MSVYAHDGRKEVCMNSMTGYGKGECSIEGKKVVIELKSVNNRFLDLNIKMPRVFNFAEDFLRKSLSERLARGHVDVFVTYEDHSTDRVGLALDKAVVQNYLDMAKTLESEFGLVNDLTADRVLRLKDAVVEEVAEADEGQLSLLLSVALSGALDNLCAMREKEGNALLSDLQTRLDVVAALVDEVAQKAPSVVEDYRVKLRERVTEALGEVPLDEVRLINEVCVYSDRVNIDEEITRMRSHIDQFEHLLAQETPVGRKADFLMQEMNREANTMGSKANNAELLTLVVAIKNELEKMREQIQNLE